MEGPWTIAALASTYANLGKFDEAKSLVRRSAELLWSLLKEGREQIPEESLVIVGDVHGRYSPEEPHCRKFLIDGLKLIERSSR